MNQNTQSKIVDKISEDLSPTRNLSGLHLKIVFGIAILWTFFQLWHASPFPFWFNIGMFKGLPELLAGGARAGDGGGVVVAEAGRKVGRRSPRVPPR